MNVFSKITLVSLKKNRTRTVVTIIGIMLSSAMICSVTSFVSSFYNYLLDNAIYSCGDWHGSALDADSQTEQKLAENKSVSSFVSAQQIGYAKAEGSINENKPYLFLLGASRDFMMSMPVHITSGRYPASQNEVILPSHLYENGGIIYKLGDTLTLDIGQRSLDGAPLSQQTPFFTYTADGGAKPTGEVFTPTERHVYTVVGFYKRPNFEPYTAPGYTLITLEDASSSTRPCDVYFKLENPKDLYAFMKDNNIEGQQNYEVLMYYGVSFFDGFSLVINSLASIVILLIMFGSVALIYNAFSISVSERTRQFGLLSSVGATKKQLRKMVMAESLAVSLVGIPLGIISGLVGIFVTLSALSVKFQSIGFSVPMKFSASPLSIIIGCIISLLTVLLSASLPARRATKISAIEAIRQNRDISSTAISYKASSLVYRIFGFSGMLGQKHYKRSRKKYRTTVLSLFMSILLFVSASSLCDYLTETVEGGLGSSGYDIVFYCEPTHFSDISEDSLLSDLSNCTDITAAAYSQNLSRHITIGHDYLSSQALSGIETTTFNLRDNTATVSSLICFINDSEFSSLLKENELDEDVFMNKSAPLAVAVDGNTSFSTKDEKYIKTNILKSSSATATLTTVKEKDGYLFYGDVTGNNGSAVFRYESIDNPNVYLDVTREDAYEDISLKIGHVIKDCPYYVDSSAGLFLFYPQSFKSVVFPNIKDELSSYKFFFLSENHSESYKSLRSFLFEKGFNGNNLFNYAEQTEQSENIITIIKVFAFGFIVLISLIASANVFNTISTNINLRRREFAMLRSVGLSSRGLIKLLNFECVLYGARALLLGLPVSAIVSFIIYLAVSSGYYTSFRLPFLAMGISSLSVFIVVFITMLYSMKKIKNDNLIDALKNENL